MSLQFWTSSEKEKSFSRDSHVQKISESWEDDINTDVHYKWHNKTLMRY